MASHDTNKLKKLVERLRELQAQTYEVTEELNRLLNGDTGIGDQIKLLERVLSQYFDARYGTPYVWQYKRDRPGLKRLLQKLTPKDIENRWSMYLQSSDSYYVQARHPFGLFESQINRFVPARMEHEALPVDCHHSPPCKSDVEHTRKRSSEMRGGNSDAARAI